MSKYSRNNLFKLPCRGGEGIPNLVHLKSIILKSSKIEPEKVNLPDLKGKKFGFEPEIFGLVLKNLIEIELQLAF